MIGDLMSLHNRLKRLGVDAILFNTSEFLPSYNLTYLSGFTGSECAILITDSERHLFTDGRYKTQSAQQAPGFDIHISRNKLGAIARALKTMRVARLGIESSRVSYQFVNDLLKRVRNIELVPLSRNFLENLRIRKSVEEKEKIRRAAKIASEACREVIGKGLVGKTESQIAADLESVFRLKGAEGPAFDTIVASGDRSALPHGAASQKVVQKGEFVVIDYGCKYMGYRSDETVTCITGSPTPEQNRIYLAVYNAHWKAVEAVKEGISVRKMDSIARKVIEESGYGKYFMHGLGHGIGLETHEPPYLSQRGRGVLKERMVFTIEPGIYIEGVGGVRLESLIYLSSTGPEILSEMPKDLILTD